MPEPSGSHETEIDEIPTVFRDENGLIEFPSIIPPADVRTRTEANPSAPNVDLAPLAGQTQAADSPRPILSREWQTEKPNHVVSKPTMPNLTRYATRASARNNAIGDGTPSPLTREEEDGSASLPSSSSESESEDEDEAPQQKRPGRMARFGTYKPQPKQQSMKPDSRGNYKRFDVGNDDYNTKGKVSKNDGRLKISVKETGNKGYLAKALGATFLKNIGQGKDIAEIEDEASSAEKKKKRRDISRKSSESTLTSDYKSAALNIVIMVIGSRGDIQPFLKVGKVLKEDYGHRVRIATHPAFQEFVENDSQLEFFSVGGDPAELMAFMVKNPGMIPKMDTFRNGEVGRRREAMAEMFQGFWRACINATDDEHDVHNLKMMGDKSPFIADAIVANPPCFAHVHCAERLGIPLHLMFTFPYTPTQAFPHPLANIKKTNVDPGYTNFMSYPLVEMMTWQGLGDLVNDFRVKTLGLEPVSTLWAPGQLYRLRVPYTYLWSPGLVPKPKDWGPEIDVAGFVFLDLASTFDPPEALVKFLEAGEPPIYIGFGSIVVGDPDHFTQMIYKGVEAAGVRALVSKGWGGLGDDDVPDNIFMLDNTPHDWLFPRVKAVIHHGGAGTTAIGLKCGKPTMVVPFFGDQFFWGNMIAKAGAGAMPIPYKNLTEENLAEGIKQLLSEEVQAVAQEIAKDIEEEGDGAHNAVKSFHRCLSSRGQQLRRCTFLTDRLAIWSLKKTNIRLSALAADILVTKKEIHWKQLRLLRHVEWNDFEGPGEPITGGASAIAGNLTSMATGIGSIPFRLVKSAKSRQLHEEKKKRKQLRAKTKAEAKARNRDNSLLSNGSKKATDSNGWTTKDKNKNDLTKGIAKQDMLPENEKPGNSKDKSQDSNTPTRTLSKKKSGASRTHDDNATDDNSILSAEPDLAEDIAGDVGHGFQKTGEAMLRAPMDLSVAVAQGFHNAPRLYGDTTVRRPSRVTGMKSGLRAAGHEFIYGIFDGVTGLVVQPYTNARRDGPIGFVKGVGMGVTGFVLKDLAALIGPFGYAMKGVQKEVQRGRQPTGFIRRARIVQGQRDVGALAKEDLVAVVGKVTHGWGVVQELFRKLDADEHHLRGKGLGGRVKAFMDRKLMGGVAEFDSVDEAEGALKAIRNGDGEALEKVLEGIRRRVEGEERRKGLVLRRDGNVEGVMETE